MADLARLIEKYRKGRDGFDSLALEATRLYLSGQLLPALESGRELPIEDRIQALTAADLEQALDGNLGAEPMTRDEFLEVLTDIVEFLKDWIGSDGGLL